ncbi:MAG TPA: acyl-CoA dehydrogenase family protein [Pseudonocardiaceae bacterium]|nr:acyl-CoA dehydrogenase family protein [Pseudonocardiaceae bacterium]
MENTQVDKLASRAAELVPLLKANAAWTEENRRLHEECIEAMGDAGIFKMRVPKRYGGYEVDARTLVDVFSQLGRGCGSTSWNAAVWSITGWIACMFSDEAQDEVFSTPDARVCGTLSPSAMAAPADGGVVINGKWGFISGALHSHWQVLVSVLITPDGSQPPMPIFALAPLSQLTIVDDWHTTGLRGTGSVSTVAQDLFVPQHRVLPLPLALQEQYLSKANAGSPIYRQPLLPTAAVTSVGTAVGLAKAACEAFLERLPDKKITYTGYEKAAEAPVMHLRVAEATMLADDAEFHAKRLAGVIDGKSASGDAWTLTERARARADMARACHLGREAADMLASASGGSSVYSNVPIQRIARDLQTINLHALMNPTTNYELYGRVLCDQPPNTLYI